MAVLFASIEMSLRPCGVPRNKGLNVRLFCNDPLYIPSALALHASNVNLADAWYVKKIRKIEYANSGAEWT